MRPSLDSLVQRAAALLPSSAVDALFRQWVGESCVAVCLHRVVFGERRRGELLPEMAIPAGELDAFITRALATRPAAAGRWLTISFDDGYADAAEYVRTRAARFPGVEWLFFVCPEKVERQAAFRWDLAEVRGAHALPERMAVLRSPWDVDAENARPELREVAQRAEFRLADADACRALAALPGVTLGNHTNLHANPLLLQPAQVEEEYGRSHRDFERLFGPCRQFAFPLGTPEVQFRAEQVERVRRLCAPDVLWSTEARPYLPAERVPGAVLPRFALDGRWSAGALLLLVAARALRFRLRGSRFHYPVAPEATRPAAAPAA